jgi:hypothetical protein
MWRTHSRVPCRDSSRRSWLGADSLSGPGVGTSADAARTSACAASSAPNTCEKCAIGGDWPVSPTFPARFVLFEWPTTCPLSGGRATIQPVSGRPVRRGSRFGRGDASKRQNPSASPRLRPADRLAAGMTRGRFLQAERLTRLRSELETCSAPRRIPRHPRGGRTRPVEVIAGRGACREPVRLDTLPKIASRMPASSWPGYWRAGVVGRAWGVSLSARSVGSPDEEHRKQEKKEGKCEERPEEWNR